MTHNIDYPIGASVWQELHVRSLEGVPEFYERVLGLDFEAEPGGGTLTRGGKPVGGVHVNPGLTDPEVGWHVFLGAEDLGAAVDRAVSAGARVLRAAEPMRIDGNAVWLEDPFGALFGLATPAPGQAVPVSAKLGFMSLVDPTNHDLETQVAFHHALFPDSSNEGSIPGDVQFFRNAEGLALRGSYEIEEEARAFLPPHWLPWFNVANQTDAVETAAAAGGTVNTRDNVSSFGTWGVVVDPAGGVFKTLQMAAEAL